MLSFADEAPFDGVSRRSVRLAIDELRTARDRHSESRNLDSVSRLEVVIQALEQTLKDHSIEWLDV